MNTVPNSLSEPRELGRLLVVYWRRWAIVTLLATAAAAAYALVAPKTWLASQALIVRNEAGGGETEPGKFRGAEDLKNIQETIMELSKSHGVLKAALVEVGPPADCARPSAWPSDNNVESLQKAVKIVPPKGVEFGTSEVFYLEVRDKDRARVAALSSALSRQLQLQLQEIRDAKAQSMIDELNKAVQVAQDRPPGRDRAVDRTGKGGRQRSAGASLAAGCELQRHVAPPHGFGNRERAAAIPRRRRRPIGNCWPCSSRPRPTRPG